MRIAHLNRQRNTVGDSGRPIDIEFTGPLILSGDPTEGVDAATKQYVDNRFLSLSASDLKSGILPIGRLPAFSGDLTNVAGSNVFTLNPTGVTSGTYRKVTVDVKGRVIGSSALGDSDIPPLDWTKITKNKPTTLAGYGITDGINLTGDTIVGTLKSNATPTAAMHAVTRAYIETAASGAGGLVSPGVIIGFPTTTTPSGYLRCNGGEVNKTTYAALYAVVGDLFGGDLMPGSGQPWRQQYAFNTEQSADITGWSTGPSLPDGLRYSQAIVTKNRVYLLGGVNTGGSVASIVRTAPINTDGTLGTWTTATSLPGNLYASQAIVTKNRVYLLGGNNGPSLSTVYTAPINADGTLGTWTTGTSLPGALGRSQVIVTKNRVYLLGGEVGTEPTSIVYTAPINEDGTLGTWTTGPSLPETFFNSQAIVTKNRVYLLNGLIGSTWITSVYTAPINTDGTLGTWTTGPSLPQRRYSSQAIVTKNRVYLLGGLSSGSYSEATVYTAPINEDGTLGTWNTGTSLPGTLAESQAIVTKNRVYLLGGISGGWVSTVYTAPFAGGSNDYSDYYNGNITPVTNDDNFRLPDYTSRETSAERYYIKY